MRDITKPRSSARPLGLGRKVLLALFVLACLLLGIVGIILPVLPGLIFLALAAVAAARLSPWLQRRLHRHPATRPYLRESQRFLGLGWQDQLRYGFWMSARLLVDSTRWTLDLLKRLPRLTS